MCPPLFIMLISTSTTPLFVAHLGDTFLISLSSHDDFPLVVFEIHLVCSPTFLLPLINGQSKLVSHKYAGHTNRGLIVLIPSFMFSSVRTLFLNLCSLWLLRRPFFPPLCISSCDVLPVVLPTWTESCTLIPLQVPIRPVVYIVLLGPYKACFNHLLNLRYLELAMAHLVRVRLLLICRGPASVSLVWCLFPRVRSLCHLVRSS